MRKLLTWLLLVLCTAVQARTVKVWEGTPVHAASVTLTEYLPEGEPRAAVVVCPGGSYFWLDKEGEGSLVGEWLASPGSAPHVLPTLFCPQPPPCISSFTHPSSLETANMFSFSTFYHFKNVI